MDVELKSKRRECRGNRLATGSLPPYEEDMDTDSVASTSMTNDSTVKMGENSTIGIGTFNKQSAAVRSNMTITTDRNTQSKAWDMFQDKEREMADSGEMWKNILQVLRLFVYLIILVSLLLGGVSSQVTLLLLSSKVQKGQTEVNEYTSLLLFCICTPIALNWLFSIVRALFGCKEWPSIWNMVAVTLIEGLQTFGVCLLLYRVFPSTDFFSGMLITLALCQIPSFLKFVTYCKRPSQGWRGWIVTAFNLVAFLVQLSAVPIYMTQNYIGGGNLTCVSDNKGVGQEPLPSPTSMYQWELPAAIFCISLSWWENFVSDDWTFSCGRLCVPLLKWKITMHDIRDTTYMFVGLFKIGLAVLLSHVLVEDHEFVLPTYSSSNSGNGIADYFSFYELMSIQIGCGLACTYLAGMACKLHMQIWAFALPLILAPVGSIALIFCQCRYHFLGKSWCTTSWLCPDNNLSSLWIPLTCAAVLWVSNVIILSHIWFPKSERMAKRDRLFVMPNYEGILAPTSLMVRRRRDDKESWLFRDQPQDEETAGYSDEPPMVYVCATMWHETRREMTQLLKSLFRLDASHCASYNAQKELKISDPDYYNLEVHMIFDDAFEDDEATGQRVPNMFVQQLCDCIPDAARSVAKGPINVDPPEKTTTQYGGRLTWTMPGNTNMIVHLKDKNKIRHRKRWSQVMYMYYLLGYKLLGSDTAEAAMTNETRRKSEAEVSTHNRKKKLRNNRQGPISSGLKRLPREILKKAENTFILALDGDVDFRPDAVKLLIDRMKKNKKVGAVCGRIHPIGSGPMVWYQQFEYSVGHWLQKAAEHVFGCVLCCPGCFSLFRGSAIMDDNVIKTYTTKPTEATHYIQFEQGEDRWLCTLLLQQGHKIDYCAVADALTFAPETFEEFFNQRRRWSPSTMANQIDLLSTWRSTVKVNDNISKLYILYQFILMASTILAPSTIVLVITGSFHSILKLGLWSSYALSVLPVFLFSIVCMKCKTKTQLKVAEILSTFYTVVMVIVTLGTIFNIVNDEFTSPNVLFLAGLGVIFFIAGCLHPQEFTSLIYGLLYFLTVPSTFILLTVFYLFNMHNVSWGTRELPKKMTKEEMEAQRQEMLEKQQKKRTHGLLGWLGLGTIAEEVKEMIRNIIGNKNKNRGQDGNAASAEEGEATTMDNTTESVAPLHTPPSPVLPPVQTTSIRDTTKNSGAWLNVDFIGNGNLDKIETKESEFWEDIIRKYLYPIDEDKNQQKKIKEDLISLRNNVVFAFMLVNFLWTVIALQLQLLEDDLKGILIGGKYEPLSLLFLAVFAFILILQFLAMFAHRWGAFLHLMSTTHINWFKKNPDERELLEFALKKTLQLATFEPEADYSDIESTSDDDTENPDIHPDPDYDDDTNSNVSVLQNLYSRNLNMKMRKIGPQDDPASPVRRTQNMLSPHGHNSQRNRQLWNEFMSRSISRRGRNNEPFVLNIGQDNRYSVHCRNSYMQY